MESEMEAEAEPLKQSDVLPKQIREVLAKAQLGWLKNTEVCDVLYNYKSYNLKVCTVPPVRPPGGSIFLFDRKSVRFFRKDGHNWRKKADGKTVRETHEKLKVGNEEILNCYYAHADQEDNLQRRCYWLLDSDDNIVLVHYLNVSQSAQRSVAQPIKAPRESTRKHLARVKFEHQGDDFGSDRPKDQLAPPTLVEQETSVLDKKTDIQPSPGVLYVSRPVLEQQSQALVPTNLEGQSKPAEGGLPHSYSFDSLLTALDDKTPDNPSGSRLFHQNSATAGMLDSFFQGWEPMEQTPSLDPAWQADAKDQIDENGSPTSGFFEQAGITFFGAASSLVGNLGQQSAAMSPMVEAPSQQLHFDFLENQDALNLPSGTDKQQHLPPSTTYCQPLSAVDNNHGNISLSSRYYNDSQPVSAPPQPQPSYYSTNYPMQLSNTYVSAPSYGPYQQGQTYHPAPAPPPPPPPPPPLHYQPPQQSEQQYYHAQQQQYHHAQQFQHQQQEAYQGEPNPREQQHAHYVSQRPAHQESYQTTHHLQYARPPQGNYAAVPQNYSQPQPLNHYQNYYVSKAAPSHGNEPAPARDDIARNDSSGRSALEAPVCDRQQGKAATRKKAHGTRKTQTRDRATNKRDVHKGRTGVGSYDKPKVKSTDAELAAMDAEVSKEPFTTAAHSTAFEQNSGEASANPSAKSSEYSGRWQVAPNKEAVADTDEDERGMKAWRGTYQADRALELHKQLHDLDQTVRTELTGSSGASVADQVKAWEARLQQLENATKGKPGRVKSEPADGDAAQNTEAGHEGQRMRQEGDANSQDVRMAEDQNYMFSISEYTPEWDFTAGGAKMIVTITGGSEPISAERMGPLFVMFDREQVPVTILCPGVLRCFVPSHEAGLVDLCVTFGDGKARSKKHGFEYRPTGTSSTLLLPRSATDMTDRELQMRMINILLGNRVASSMHLNRASIGGGAESCPNNALALVESVPQGFFGDVELMSADSREQLLMLLLEHEIHKFTAEVVDKRLQAKEQLQSAYGSHNKMNQLGLDVGLALIHITAALGYNWAVQMLLTSGADINLRDSWGFSALHWAAGRGREDTVALLVARGAKPNMLTPESSIPPAVSPADLAAMKGHQGIAAYIGETMLIRSLSQMKLNKTQQQGVPAKSAAQRKRSRHVRNESSEMLQPRNPFTTAPQLQAIVATSGPASSGGPPSPEQEDDAMVVAQRAKEAAAIIEAAYLNHLQRKALRQERRWKLKQRETEAVAHIEESMKAWQAVSTSTGQRLPEQDKARVLDLGQRILQKYAELRLMLHHNNAGSDSELPDLDNEADQMEDMSDTNAVAIAQPKLHVLDKPRRILRTRRASGVKSKESTPELSKGSAAGELLKEQYRKTLAAAVGHVESIVSCEGARAQYMRLKQACSSLSNAYTAAQQLAQQAVQPSQGMLPLLDTPRLDYSVLV